MDCLAQSWTKAGFSWAKNDIKLTLELDTALGYSVSSRTGVTDVSHAILHTDSNSIAARKCAQSIEAFVIDNGGIKGGPFAARVEKITIFKNKSLINAFNERMSLSSIQRNQSAFDFSSWDVGSSDTEFLLKQEFYNRLEGFLAESDDQAQPPNVNVTLMWHGVPSDEVADSIFRSGLSSRVSASTDQGFFGKGIYLTPEAEYAAFYANKQQRPKGDETYTLVLCAVCFASAYPVTRGVDYAPDAANGNLVSCKYSYSFGAHNTPKALKPGHDAHFIAISVAPPDTNDKPYQTAKEAACVDYHELVVSEESQVLPFAKVLIRVGNLNDQ